ncbi:MAG: PD-(D/E)XK nuclease family protein [Flavobacteriaceae bacterium]
MRTFLEEVVDEVWKKYDVLEDIIFVLPSKRAGSFLRAYFAKTAGKTIFSPKILSIEAFVESMSGLTKAGNTQLLFELFRTYQLTATAEKDNFHDFSNWGQMLLQDYNEIDRYLVAPDKIFAYLFEIQELNHWYLHTDKTPMMKAYVQFWKDLPQLYLKFTKHLLSLGIGYQGLIYRKAVANLDDYLKSVVGKNHIFIGFNALNAAESYIIQEVLSNTDSEIYWDIDQVFLEDPVHDAGYFIRQHKRDWKYLQGASLKGPSRYYNSAKHIEVIGVPKHVSQVKYVGCLLRDLKGTDLSLLKGTAVVLGDEALLNPLLNSIPPDIETINITMGYPLEKTPLSGMFKQFFEINIQKEQRGWFYKNVFSFLSNNYIQLLLSGNEKGGMNDLLEFIKEKNWVYITHQNINFLENTYGLPLSFLFFEQNSPISFIRHCLDLIKSLKLKFEENNDNIGLEYLYHFYIVFNQLDTMLKAYSFIEDLKSLYSLFKELLSSETVDFQGEPMEGLQIMGMLESRNLDFETVIITSVNEGILPSGKSNNSFIPYDIKKEFGLPTYKEKDAVYTYHFYRLLQRAKRVYILYNTEADVLEGGEKSRFITQLLTEHNTATNISEIIASPTIKPQSRELQNIPKQQQLLEQLKQIGAKGFSPTSLSNYIRNPIGFYKKVVLHIDDPSEVEETIAANTFGTIIHDVLEELYLPFTGSILTVEKLNTTKLSIEKTVKRHFSKTYSDAITLTGKNLIAYHVVCRYIRNFIALELKEVAEHEIKIIALEKKMQVELQPPNLSFPVLLKGKLDRVDQKDGVLRIIDYKTGNTKRSEVEVIDWGEVTTDYERSKAFQLLCYALMYTSEHPVDSLQAGIISFKNLSNGLLHFAKKENKGSRSRNTNIDRETISVFRQELYRLIQEIYNPEIAFKEKVV